MCKIFNFLNKFEKKNHEHKYTISSVDKTKTDKSVSPFTDTTPLNSRRLFLSDISVHKMHSYTLRAFPPAD